MESTLGKVREKGKHLVVKVNSAGEPYPIPCSHGIVNKHIIKKFSVWLKENDVCTEKEFEDLI